MGRKLVIGNNRGVEDKWGYRLVDAVAMGADITSDKLDIDPTDILNFLVAWSAGATPVGTIEIQYSNDNITWRPLNFGSSIAVSGNSGDHDIMVEKCNYKYLRFFYDRSSGNATMNVEVRGKTIGA